MMVEGASDMIDVSPPSVEQDMSNILFKFDDQRPKHKAFLHVRIALTMGGQQSYC